jgi:hypothetical protein
VSYSANLPAYLYQRFDLYLTVNTAILGAIPAARGIGSSPVLPMSFTPA